MIKLNSWILVACLMPSAISSVSAGTINAQISVSAQFQPACQSLSTTSMNFGSVPSAKVLVDSTSTITVTCTNLVPYDVTIDNGLHPPLGATQRKMANAGNLLDYELYLDVAHTQRWHDAGFLSGTFKLIAIGSGAAQINTVFGQVTSTSSTPPGAYSDVVTVFLNF